MHAGEARRAGAGGGLVEDEQPRPDQQGGGEPETLAHPGGEAADHVVGGAGEPGLGQDVLDARRRPADAAQQGQRGQVPPGGQRRAQAGVAEETGDGVRDGDCGAEDFQAAAVRGGQAEQEAEQGGFPRPGRAGHPVDLTGRDVEVDAVERDGVIEGFPQPAGPHRGAPVRDVFGTHTGNTYARTWREV